MEDQQKATKVTLYLPSDLHRQLKIRSAVDGEPMSTMAERALKFYLSHADVVEASTEHGSTYKTYSCPSCADSVVVRDGQLVSVKEAIQAAPSDGLPVAVPEVVAEGSRPEEGQLVHC
ncbi:MAG: hypothetical protein ACFB12_08140 [Leptolyngbyaceae cyanobacterium]